MTAASERQPLYGRDLEFTRQVRERLKGNANLLHWYRELYRELFAATPGIESLRVLEIGSGASPLKTWYPAFMTSDVLELEHVDHVFDCHELGEYDAIPDASVDVIVLTNVLHHLRDPIAFLLGASRKLAPGGQVCLVEPYFSALSYPLYKWLHHEPADFGISRPVLDQIEGPLSTSNQAIPHMIFFSCPQWREMLAARYDLGALRIGYFTGLSYMMTGGVSRVFGLPGALYRGLFAIDRALARSLPRLFASFFVARLKVADGP